MTRQRSAFSRCLAASSTPISSASSHFNLSSLSEAKRGGVTFAETESWTRGWSLSQTKRQFQVPAFSGSSRFDVVVVDVFLAKQQVVVFGWPPFIRDAVRWATFTRHISMILCLRRRVKLVIISSWKRRIVVVIRRHIRPTTKPEGDWPSVCRATPAQSKRLWPYHGWTCRRRATPSTESKRRLHIALVSSSIRRLWRNFIRRIIYVDIIIGGHARHRETFIYQNIILVTFWSALLPYGYSYKTSCGRPGQAFICNFWHPSTLTLWLEPV